VAAEPEAPKAEEPKLVAAEIDAVANSLEDQVKRDIAKAVAAVENPVEDVKAAPVKDEVESKVVSPDVGASEIIKPKGKTKIEHKPVDNVAPRGRTKGTLDLQPSRVDLVKGAASTNAVDAIGHILAVPEKVIAAVASETAVEPVKTEPPEIEPALDPINIVPPAQLEIEPHATPEIEPLALTSILTPNVEPEPVNIPADDTPVHVIDHAAEAEAAVVTSVVEASSEQILEPAPAPSNDPTMIPPGPAAIVEAPVSPLPISVASEAPIPQAEPIETPTALPIVPGKEPLIAKTHPESSSAKTAMMIVGALVIVTCAAVAAYYFTLGKPANKVGQNASSSRVASAGAASEPAAVLDASTTPTPSASVAASSQPSSAQARDVKREDDLATYSAAVKALGSNGFYPTAVPAISGQLLDPTTGNAYIVATVPAASLGAIQYLAGGKCGAPTGIPGKISTRYISLSTKLETASAPYCINVQ
jgi:hypothetical protein